MKIGAIGTSLFDRPRQELLLFCRRETSPACFGWGRSLCHSRQEQCDRAFVAGRGEICVGRSAHSIRHSAQVIFDDFAMRRASLICCRPERNRNRHVWDIAAAKAAGQPLYNLLGGPSRERVGVYANGWSSGTATIEENLACTEGHGSWLIALKWDPFPSACGVTSSTARTRITWSVMSAACGNLWPRLRIAVEVHRRLAPMHAIRESVDSLAESGHRVGMRNPVCGDNTELVLAEVRRALPGVPGS